MKNKKRILFILCLPFLLLFPYFSFAQGIEITNDTSPGTISFTGAATIEIVNGEFINNGTYTKATETVTFSGTTPKTISGSSITDIHNLTVTNTGGITIAAGKKLTVSGTLTNSAGTAGLVIQSTSDAATGTGSLINSTVGISATVERWMTGNIWHLISPAATGQTASNFINDAANNIASNTTNYGLAPYRETDNKWDYFKVAGITGSMDTPAKGYQVLRSANGTVSFKGQLAAADQTISIARSSFGWNLIGNPYPCAIDINTFLANTSNISAIDGSYLAIYVSDLASSTGGYTAINNTSNLKLSSGEAFFVKSDADGGTINFTTAMKTHTSDAFKSAVIQNEFNLIAESAGDKRITSVKYIPQMTAGLDPGWDAGLFNSGPASFELFTHLVEDNGVDFTIQCLPDNDYENLVVPVGLNAKQGETITFSLTEVSIPGGYKVFLEDKVNGKFTRLDEQGSSYTVQLNTASNGTGRFFLHTKQEITGINDGLSNNFAVIPEPMHQLIRVSGVVNLPAQAVVYDLNGRMITIKKLTSLNENEIPLLDVSNGIYLIKIVSDKQSFQKKFSWLL